MIGQEAIPSRTTNRELAWAIAVPRMILGFVYFFAGLHKIVDVGPVAFGQGWAMSDGARFLPGSVLMAAGTLVPFIELTLGFFVLVGLWTRPALRALAAVIVLVAAGYGVSGLLHPMPNTAMDITVVNRFILPRVALTIFMLMAPAEHDRLSGDGLLARRSART
jgi:uncharacterized membrane protein YphA (DoxX/SURF4 family)